MARGHRSTCTEEGGKEEDTYGYRRNRLGIFFQRLLHHYDFQSAASIYAAIDDFEATGRAQPLTPGRASQAVEMQEQPLLPEFEELGAHELPIGHVVSDEGESEMDQDDPTLFDHYYPSESEAGEDNNIMVNVGGTGGRFTNGGRNGGINCSR